ncbi:MAG TPA: type IV secretory system conjugative DNA transfer family protein [Pirellulales bacterium]|nr:type IV secretory system conjugative DNA transfer family protein [Pirellulales bacterium]
MSFYRQMLVVAVVAIALPCGLAAWMYPYFVLTVVAVVIVVHCRKKKNRLTTLGSARWAGSEDLRRAGMLDADSGLILGRVTDSPQRAGPAIKALFDRQIDDETACKEFLAMFRQPEQKLVRLPNAVHTAVFAPTGVGKGVSFVIPFLQTCPDSCVVVDVKGELASLTGTHREKVFGHEVRILDPYKVVTQTPDTFNPLDFIKRESPLAIDACFDLANAFVIRTGQERDPHFPDSAEALIAGLCSMVVQFAEPGDDRSLQAVRTLLSNPKKLEAAIALMQGSDAWGGMLRRIGGQLAHFKDKELSSVLTTTNRFLRFLDTIAVAENTRTSSFDPARLRNGKMTVYLVLPPEHLRAQAALMRMWIGAMLRAVVEGGLQQ